MILYQAKFKKLYAYVDESGQDTKGLVFIVSVLVLERDLEKIGESLKEIETESGKKNAKWHKSSHESRKKYFEKILEMDGFKNSIFFDSFSDTKKYIELTAFATAKAILKKSDGSYRATIFVDGLKRKEIQVFTKGIRDLRIRTKKIRGVKRDENNVFIRLVDAACGLVRDANQGNKWTKEILEKLKRKSILKEL